MAIEKINTICTVQIFARPKSSFHFYGKLNPYVSPMVSESIQALSIREGAHSNVVNTKAANVWQIKSSKYFWASKMTKFIKDSNYRSIKVLRIKHYQKITLEFIKGCQISWHYQLETQIFNGYKSERIINTLRIIQNMDSTLSPKLISLVVSMIFKC